MGSPLLLVWRIRRQWLDTSEKIEQIYNIANETAETNVFPFGSITKGLAGEELTDMRGMYSAGAVGFTDDGVTVMNAALMRDALALSAELGFPIMVHCEEHNLNAGAIMNLGETSKKLGLIGSPNAAEDIIVATRYYVSRDDGWTPSRATR